jgi:hypothetical protein
MVEGLADEPVDVGGVYVEGNLDFVLDVADAG